MGLSRRWSEKKATGVRARVSPNGEVEVWSDKDDTVMNIDVEAWRELLNAIRAGRLGHDQAA